jgi:hypothetical protein
VSTVPLVAKLGICELAFAALTGWAMVLTVERPDLLRRLGLRHLGRIRQAHLDLLFMGTILTAVGTAVRPIPTWVAVPLVLGAFVQPLMFVPLAVDAAIREKAVYRAANAAVFLGTSVAWIALAAIAVSR